MRSGLPDKAFARSAFIFAIAPLTPLRVHDIISDTDS
jgi:hypothetical protein